MAKETSIIHEKVGKIFQEAISKSSGLTLLKDQACGGRQHLPLFWFPKKNRANELCNVDLLVLKGGKIRLIVEIEESNVKPTQVCGKFLTSALSKYYIHESEGNKPVNMADSVLFLQIVDTSRLIRRKTAKFKQWKALENSINKLLPVGDSRIRKYRLITTDELEQLDSIIREIS